MWVYGARPDSAELSSSRRSHGPPHDDTIQLGVISVQTFRTAVPRFIAMGFLALLLAGVGCARKGPVSVRFDQHVDETKLAELPRRSGSIVLVAGPDFWTDRKRVSQLPIVRREQTYIIGPGAAHMAETMLDRMFEAVERTRHLNRVEGPKDYAYVIRLIHTDFDDRTLFLPFFSNQRYRRRDQRRPVAAGGSGSRRSDGPWIPSPSGCST